MRSCLLALVLALVACTPATHGTPSEDPKLDGTPGPVCVYAGKGYQVGEGFPAEDGCNQCSCHGPGAIVCTTKGCSAPPVADVDAGSPAKISATVDAEGKPACLVEGKIYKSGEQFPDPDSCNKCTCRVSNGVAGGSCTEIHCPNSRLRPDAGQR